MNDLSNQELRGVTLLDLPGIDIVQSHILPYLSLEDLFQFKKASQQCSYLVETYLFKCRTIDLSSENQKLLELSFQVIAKVCNKIEVLIFRSCKWLTDDGLVSLLKENSNIKEIRLAGCQNVTESSIFVLAQKNSLNLSIVNLRDCHWMTPEAVERLAFHCPNLTYVDFTSCWLINDQSITTLMKNNKRLRSISLAKIYGITDLSLIAIANNCRHLSYLDLFGCWRITNNGIRMIGEYCKELKTLKILQCRDITESSLSALRDYVDIDLPVKSYFLSDFIAHIYLQI